MMQALADAAASARCKCEDVMIALKRLLLGAAIISILSVPAAAQTSRKPPDASSPPSKQDAVTRSDGDDDAQSGGGNAQSGAEYDAYGMRYCPSLEKEISGWCPPERRSAEPAPSR